MLNPKRDPERDYMLAIRLSVLVDSPPILQALLEFHSDGVIFICHPLNLLLMRLPGKLPSEASRKVFFSSFLLAAAIEYSGIIKLFLKSNRGQFHPRFDPFIEDRFCNTALHYVFKRKPV